MNYRPEVDGLRAVAVLSVIFFHAGFGLFGGGFVGVDVFFVISGYLITTIIVNQLATGTFHLGKFFERRVRRILPALFVVMLLCIPFASLWMLPDELENMGQSLVASTWSSNNILLAMTAGYWEAASEFKPLLHTWSLGAEEQYYFFVPLILMVIWRFARTKIMILLGVMAVVSFALAQYWLVTKPDFGFYMLPSRAWELLVGALVALSMRGRHELPRVSPRRRHLASRGGWQSRLLPLAGLGMLLGSVATLDSTNPLMATAMTFPVVGTALIIRYTEPGSLVGKILGQRILVGVGLISFSAYLWHQPLFAFARIYSREAPNALVFIALILATVGLAWVTYRWVETPFRKPGQISRRVLYSSVSVAALLTTGIGLSMNATNGFPGRIYADNADDFAGSMTISYNEKVFELKQASFPEVAPPGAVNMLVVGNSFARDFTNAVREVFPAEAWNIVYRDDLYDCSSGKMLSQDIYVDADVVVFASGVASPDCVQESITRIESDGKSVFYAGTKHFGDNLNWLTRVPEQERGHLTNVIPALTLTEEAALKQDVPAKNFISWFDHVAEDGRVPFTDSSGRLLSGDRRHFTEFGARYFGERALLDSPLAALVKTS
ncbi:acyltransferase [Arthrobacter sp. 754]|uniref:acyltransferase family protein n=1 Tax=Arthrobacter sp. 754 TaxID=3156315 RepID=UPI0033934BF7